MPVLPRVFRRLIGVFGALLPAGPAVAQRQMEALDRGVAAMRTDSGAVHLSWRLVGTDPDDLAFNLYRTTGAGSAAATTRLNVTPHTLTTDYVDPTADPGQPHVYPVRPVLNGTELAPRGTFALAADAPARPYLTIPLTPPDGGTTPDGVAFTYSANDGSAADLDGDGDHELILKWNPSNSKDNSQSGHTGSVYIDAYTLEGIRLWRIDLGRNIPAGAQCGSHQRGSHRLG